MKRLSQIFLSLIIVLLSALPWASASAAPSVAITSPTSGAQVAGTSFTVTGTASANHQITVKVNGATVGTTTSNGSGNWSLNVANQAAGAKTVEATASIQYAYIASINPSPRLSVVNTVTNQFVGAGVSTTDAQQSGAVSPDGTQMVTVGGYPENSAIKVWDLSDPASPILSDTITAVNDYASWVTYSKNGEYFYVSSLESDFSASTIRRYQSSDTSVTSDVSSVDQAGPISMALSADGTELYASNLIGSGGNASISVIDTATNSQTDTFTIGAAGSFWRIFNGANNQGYGVVYNDNNIIPIDFTARTTDTAIAVGTNPTTGRFNSDNSLLYVSNLNSNNVSIVNTASNTVVDTKSVTGPGDLGLTDMSINKVVVAEPSISTVFIGNATTFSDSVSLTAQSASPAGVAMSPLFSSTTSVSFTLTGSSLADTGSNRSAIMTAGILLSLTGLLTALHLQRRRSFSR
jgi:DNA-binding beta-propeller fold protein YncE